MALAAMALVDVYLSQLPLLLAVLAAVLFPAALRSLHAWATDLRVFDVGGKQLPGPGRQEHAGKLPKGGWLKAMREGRRAKKASQVMSHFLAAFGDGKMMAFRVMGRNIVIVKCPALCKVILTGNHMIFPKSKRYNRLKFALGNHSLLLTNFDEWKHARTTLNPFFHFEAMRGFVQSFNSYAQRLVDFLDSHYDGGRVEKSPFVTASSLGDTLRVDASIVNNLTLAIIMQTAFSHEYDFTSITDGKATVSADITTILHELNRRVADDFDWSYLLRGQAGTLRAIGRSSTMLDDIIASRCAGGARAGGQRDILDILIESGCPRNVLRDQVLTFMAAGHETTATAMGWILYELCLNPAAQAELQRELDAVLQGPSEEVTLDDAAALLYTQQVIKEALRLHPPIPIVAKECLEDTRLGDYNVPAGSVLAISISDLHMNPDLFPSPLRFDPTRFEKSHAVNPFAFAPFAAGPRNCIGQKFAMLELTVLIARLLRRYEVSMDEQARAAVVCEETIVQALRSLFFTAKRRATVSDEVRGGER